MHFQALVLALIMMGLIAFAALKERPDTFDLDVVRASP